MKMNKKEAREFASKWLPAWTGNEPERLAEFYSDDCFYLDPAIPSGVNGKAELLSYFKKLLSQNPNWIWTQIEPIPMEEIKGTVLFIFPPSHLLYLFRNLTVLSMCKYAFDCRLCQLKRTVPFISSMGIGSI